MPMIDVSCPGCRKRYGFSGEIIDCPPCPRCGKAPDRDALESDQKKMDGFRELLRTLPAKHNCARQRQAAGLTAGQAAKVLGVTPEELHGIEQGPHPLTADMRAKMIRAYGLTAKVEELSKG